MKESKSVSRCFGTAISALVIFTVLTGCSYSEAAQSDIQLSYDSISKSKITCEYEAGSDENNHSAIQKSNTAKSDNENSLSDEESTEEGNFSSLPSSQENESESETSSDSEESSPKISSDDNSDKVGTIFSAEYANLTISSKISLLRSFFPSGYYWNSHDFEDTVKDESKYQAAMHVSTVPCSNFGNDFWCNAYNGITKRMFTYDGDNIQCLGFASMISDFLWGEEAPIYVSYDIDDIEVGDHIRFISLEHSVTVISKSETSIKVVECNRDYEDCLIEWDREIPISYLISQNFEILKRGENPDGETFYLDAAFSN